MVLQLFPTIIAFINPVNWFKKWWQIRGFKKWFLAVLVVFLGYIAFSQALAFANRGKPNLAKYQIVKVEKGDLDKKITKEGVLRFAGVVEIPAPASGVITDIWVKDGDTVKKGQKLLSLESTATKLDRSQALSQYLAAKNTLDKAKTAKMESQVSLEAARKAVLVASQARQNLDDRFASGDKQNPDASRPNKNYTDNEIQAIHSEETQARSRFSIAEREYNTADASIQSAQAAVDSSWWSYELTKNAIVTAPVSGTVANMNYVKGETLKSKDGVLLRLINSSDQIITLKVSEAEILQYRVGQPVEFKTGIYLDHKFTGKIIQVDTLGNEVKNDSGTNIEYTVKIRPDPTDKQLLSPLTVDTETIVNHQTGVLTVPNSAVSYLGGKRTVQVVKDNQVSLKEVVVGILANDKTEIISGLSEGETVLVPRINKI